MCWTENPTTDAGHAGRKHPRQHHMMVLDPADLAAVWHCCRCGTTDATVGMLLTLDRVPRRPGDAGFPLWAVHMWCPPCQQEIATELAALPEGVEP